MIRLLNVVLIFIFIFTVISAQTGDDAKWESAGKQGIGTALSLNSKVWFTLQGGSLTEVFYPTADMANVQLLQFVVVDPVKKTVETERDDADHKIKPLRPDSLSFQQINTAKSGEWTLTKTYTTDPERDSVLIDVRFQSNDKNLNLYIYYDPSLGNSGMGDTASTKYGPNDADVKLVVEKASPQVASALLFTSPISELTNDYFEQNDGLTQLRQCGKIVDAHEKVANGNVVQLARIVEPGHFTAVLSFGKEWQNAVENAGNSRSKGFEKCQSVYDKTWNLYVKTLPKIGAKYQAQFNYAAMVLRASEDKMYRGGNVASLSNPWITGSGANGPYVGGYHLVWCRDLYQIATAYISIGDLDSANRALDYLFSKQQKLDGSFPQITWLDGRPVGEAIQMDEVSYPLILAYQLARFDAETFAKHIRPTADYILKTGPKTQQERWEEKPGYSPSTIAAEIAGLVCAADIAKRNGDVVSAGKWLAVADEWKANVDKWSATTTGKYGDGNYYVRITRNGAPDAGEKVELNNNAGPADERDIVDAGFLELVRLGIKSPDDKLIVRSLMVVDELLKVKTPKGDGFYRYNRDGYGEMYDGRPWNWDLKYTGKGHLWALLSGERGEFEIAACLHGSRTGTASSACLLGAEKRLDTMSGFANEGMMIPEQVWDKPDSVFPFGEGAGSATPLAWSMAQYIRLAVNLKRGKNIDTPDVVARRYVK